MNCGRIKIYDCSLSKLEVIVLRYPVVNATVIGTRPLMSVKEFSYIHYSKIECIFQLWSRISMTMSFDSWNVMPDVFDCISCKTLRIFKLSTF